MRIDFVFPKFKLLSGAERLILSLASELTKRGHRVRILCHRFDESCRPAAAGLRIEETGQRLDWTGNHYLDSISSYLLSLRLRRLIAADADVVCLFGPALPLAPWLRAPQRRVLYFCYEPPRAAGVDSSDVLARVGPLRWVLAPALRFYRAIDRWLVRQVDSVLVSGAFGQELIQREYGLPSRVITPGISLRPVAPDRSEARQTLGLDAATQVAITVNFLHPRKRVDLLLRAWAEVEKKLPEARLLVVGDGPEAESLRDLAKSLNLRGVKFCGFIPEEELPLYYAATDLLVHATRQETFGLTIIEAGAFGLPVIAVDEGGPRYTIVQGETGIRVRAEEKPLAAAISELLADRDRARKMGERGREHVIGRYAWSRGAEEFLTVCHDLGL